MKTIKRVSLLLALCVAGLVSCNKEPSGPQLPDITTYKIVTVSEFCAAPVSDTYLSVSGVIESVTDEHYSKFVLKDDSGSVNVEGLYDCADGDRIYDMASYKQGDHISIAAQKNEYKGVPEARRAFVYDPYTATLYLSKTSGEVGSDGGKLFVDIESTEQVTASSDAAWAKPSVADGKLSVEAEANQTLSERIALITLKCGETTAKFRLTQEAFQPSQVSVKDAVNGDIVAVKGTIMAADKSGFVLEDNTGAIFVEDDKFLGRSKGEVVAVTGTVSTKDYLTMLKAPIISDIDGAKAQESKPEAADAASLAALRASMAGESGTKGRTLKCVAADGFLQKAAAGGYVLADKKTGETMLNISESVTEDLESIAGKFIHAIAYISGLDASGLQAIIASVEEIVIPSIITIDGNFEDWDNPAVAVSTEHEESYPALAEVRGYADLNAVYVYYRSEKRSFLHNVRVCVDTDANAETGSGHWCLPKWGYSFMINLTPFGFMNIYESPEGGDTAISALKGAVTTAYAENTDEDTAVLELSIDRAMLSGVFPLADKLYIGIYSLGNPYWNKTGTIPLTKPLEVTVNNE